MIYTNIVLKEMVNLIWFYFYEWEKFFSFKILV